MLEMKLEDLRQEYTKAGLKREDLDSHPVAQFEQWFLQAQNGGVKEPNAMILATVADDGQPFTRTVLLKDLDDRGFVFYTNYESRKAVQISGNAKVSLLFLWLDLERQVSVNGHAEKIPSTESLKYFVQRPFGSRLGAWVSRQSSVIRSRALLEQKWEEMKRRYRDGEVPLPSFWGGYRVVPESVEFWQGRQNRLHDRFIYNLCGGGWQVERLAP